MRDIDMSKDCTGVMLRLVLQGVCDGGGGGGGGAGWCWFCGSLRIQVTGELSRRLELALAQEKPTVPGLVLLKGRL